MHIAMLAPISWRVPPRYYGPWEWVTSLLTEGLVARGVDVTLFATGDSLTTARLHAVCPHPYSENPEIDAKVCECLHICEVFEHAGEFDIIHNQFDFLPLTYSRLVRTPLVTTIHGFSSSKILPVYRKYNHHVYYVSISDADRNPDLNYIATIHHGIPIEDYTFCDDPDDYLLFLGRIHPDKGTHEAIKVAQRAGAKLIIAGIVQDEEYFEEMVAPNVDGDQIHYVGPVAMPEKGELLGHARALLHMINFDEPFGLSVVEAMATGTPVIAIDRGSMRELIYDGKTGFLVAGEEAALTSVGKIDSIDRKQCRSWVEERFTQDRMVEDYLKVYQIILEE
ncbi:MAG TPA: glycosyltransferase family 4 protein, partial [Candidatus Acetothermia bacterium]|nr:glycosyltransferase family 4 protein [Candidatus Acetothermia bacterium]